MSGHSERSMVSVSFCMSFTYFLATYRAAAMTLRTVLLSIQALLQVEHVYYSLVHVLDNVCNVERWSLVVQ